MSQEKSLLNKLVFSLQCLPGVGRKSAQRMAYHLLDKDREGALRLANDLKSAMDEIGNCERCRDYTEASLCEICRNEKRNEQTLCVVESPADVAAIESTGSYTGKYFVLMGNLSPLDGIGPDEIGLNQLKTLVEQTDCQEIIVATSATVEGEATAHFISTIVQGVKDKQVSVSRLAQGVPIGGELEYLDSSTLALSLANRQSI
ncbi:recombination protein RecR [Aliikangiella marina]|uniref:Recombination protein RecR n=1 Tax=Aliikangiella marina TaxID=1712262 RepID=A0A545TJQ7_9GAMM|nr:recombination mediator RecR [Aliikangiella marina]TQV77452.1 recombination protein RecR [Aliikangiella marina]